MRGKASTEAGAAEAVHARENGENFSQVQPSLFSVRVWLMGEFTCSTISPSRSLYFALDEFQAIMLQQQLKKAYNKGKK